MLGARGIYFGGYPWRNLGVLTADDLNAAIAVAIQEPSSPSLVDIIDAIPDGAISNSKLMYPYIVIGSTNIPLGPSNITTLTGISPPVNPGDVATKYYVDNVVGLEGYTAGVGLNLIGNQFNIAQTGVEAGTYGSPSLVPQITVNAEGQITHAGQVAILITAAQISNGVTGTGPVVLQSGPTIQGVMQVNGNLGIGTTPPAGAQNALIMSGMTGNVCSSNYAGNAYFDGTSWRYLANGAAWLFGANAGSTAWSWLYGGSGTAGGVAPFGNVAMSLTGAGNLAVASVNATGGGYIVPSGAFFAASGAGWVLGSGAGGYVLGVQGSSDPAYAFAHPNGTGLCYIYSTGDMHIAGGLSQGSDLNLKTNIAELTQGVSLARRLVPKRFKRKRFDTDIEQAEPVEEWGFVAQDVEEIIPQAVGVARAKERGVSYKTLSPTAIIACLSLALKQVIQRCEALEAAAGISPPPEHVA